MSGVKGVKKLNVTMEDLNYELFHRYHRRVIYMEMIEPRFSSMHDALIHFYLLIDGKMQEYEVHYAESAEFYHGFIGFMDRYAFADMFRNYRFKTNSFSYRVLIHKGATLDANNDLGGFVFQNNKNSYLINPHRREVFERLRDSLLNYSDGVAQLVRVGRLLKNDKFRQIHNEYFGKIGVTSLNDGSVVKMRYADSIANNNVITNQEMFKEYLDLINSIPMSEFTAQSVVSQLVDNYYDTKQILMENYSNFLFAEEDEIEFASMLLGLFLHRSELEFTTQEWIAGISYIKYLNNDTFLRMSESKLDYKRNLSVYRASYILDKVPLTKIVHFIYDFFDYKNLSQNICAFYPRINALLGEDIREKYIQLETINVSLKSLQETKEPEKFFKEPKLVNFSTSADKEIQKQIISGKYSHKFATYYLCNYMQVADYKRYSEVLPAVVSIIKNLQVENDDDYSLFWMACDVLNEFWKLIPEENKEVQKEIEKLINDIFWPRIGDVWPILHRHEVSFNDENCAKTFKESLSWIMSIQDLSLIDRKLRKHLSEKIERNFVAIDDVVDKKRYVLSFKKQKDHSLASFIGDNNNENEWCYAAIYCDAISDIEIIEKILNMQYPLSERRGTEKYVLEQLLLKTRNESNSKQLYDYLLTHFDDYQSFFDRMGNEDENGKQMMINALLALCESATADIESKYLKELAARMSVTFSDNIYEDKIQHALAVADASMRQTKFQIKNITPTFIKNLH